MYILVVARPMYSGSFPKVIRCFFYGFKFGKNSFQLRDDGVHHTFVDYIFLAKYSVKAVNDVS